jgi:uncharacterized protein involved in exopolysaccharide biosynthesis
MGLFNDEEHTLFKPTPVGRPGSAPEAPGQPYRQQAMSMVAAQPEEDERASLGELVNFAWNSAKRRKLLSLGIVLGCAALTAGAAYLAPRTYNSQGDVLVVKTEEGQQGWNPEGNRGEQMQWERQIRSRTTLDSIIKDAKIVEKWDETRPRHRVLLDAVGSKLGSKMPTAEQKYLASMAMLDTRLKLTIDSTTVTISCDWSDGDLARDVVQSAMNRFIDARYATEVGSIPSEIKVYEEQLESSRQDLEKLSPSTAPAKEKPTQITAPSMLVVTGSVDDAAKRAALDRRLADAKEKQAGAMQRLGGLEQTRNERVGQINNQIAERSTVLGNEHPEMKSLRTQLESAQRETSEIGNARAAKDAADREVADVAAQLGVVVPRPAPRLGPAAALAPDAKKIDDNTQRKIDASRDRYNDAKKQLDEENKKLRIAEARFKNKYTITNPPMAAFAPKKPVGIMVSIGGAIATMFLVLLLAALRDRASGILFEAKQVRDRLRMPVLGDLKESDFTQA